MISKNLQIKDMLGNSDHLIFPKANKQKIKFANHLPISRNTTENPDIDPDMVIFFEDYVLVREHFFQRGHLLQVAVLIRSDGPLNYFDYEKYGRYTLAFYTKISEPV